MYLSEDESFVIQQTKQPDLFRCWHLENYTRKERCEKNDVAIAFNVTQICSPRKCGSEELPNELLFYRCIPICIASLLLITIPSGFAISHMMRKKKLQSYEIMLTNWLSPVQNGFTRCKKRINCCKTKKEDVVDGIERPNAISEKVIDDKSEKDKDIAQSEPTEEVLENQSTMDEDIKVLHGEIVKPNVILQNVRRLFAPPVESKFFANS